MIWLFMEFVTVTILCIECSGSDLNINRVICLSVWLIWLTLRELIEVIEKRRKR